MPSPLLDTVGFVDREAAARTLGRLLETLRSAPVPPQIEPVLAASLREVADPDRALVTFERFVERHGRSETLLDDLSHRPRVVEMLVTVFAGSQFLAEILLRHPEYWRELGELWWGERRRVDESLGSGDELRTIDSWETLRRQQQRELLRIGSADLLGLADLPSVTAALSRLATFATRSALRLTQETAESAEELCVLAFGKLGGGELNYSSDIDLVFLTERQPGRHWRRVQSLVEGLARPGRDGFLYRVDLRLRPWGRDGGLVCSRSGYLDYLERASIPAERQALLKARPVAGDESLGQRFLDQARPLVLAGETA